MIKYVKGDATNPLGKGKKVITHCCNDVGGFGAGFALALAKKWPVVRERYILWHTHRKDAVDFRLGGVQLVSVQPNIQVANLIGQHGIGTGSNGPPIRYNAIRAGFIYLNDVLSKDTTIHMPRIGCGLAGGKWDEIEPLINEAFPNRNVTVYDFE